MSIASSPAGTPPTGEPFFESDDQVGVINDGRLIIRTPERVIASRYRG